MSKWRGHFKHQRGICEGMEQREKSSMEAKITRTARTTSVWISYALLSSCQLATTVYNVVNFVLQFHRGPIGKAQVHDSLWNAAIRGSFSAYAVDVVTDDRVSNCCAMDPQLMGATGHWRQRYSCYR